KVGVGIEMTGAKELDEVSGEVVAQLAHFAGEFVDGANGDCVILAAEELEPKFAEGEEDAIERGGGIGHGALGVEAAGNGVAWEGCAQGLRHFVFVEVAYEFGEVGDAIEFGENDVDRNLGAELLGEFAEHLVGVACSGERCIRGSGAQKNLGANADNGGADRRLLTHGGACGLGTGFADEAAPELRSLANGVPRFGKDKGVRVPQINDGSGDAV